MDKAGKVLAIIPARGGSKGLSRKNIRLLHGKPLIAWTLEAAKSASSVDRAILSTDDEEIAKVARKYGADIPFMRPDHLAKDDSTSVDVVLHALDQLPGYEWVMLLQPTSPLRTAGDIDACMEKCLEHAADQAVSVCAAKQHPAWMFHIEQECLIPVVQEGSKVTRRQDLKPTYALNGAIYLTKAETIRQSKSFLYQPVPYRMPKERSFDIDNELDLYMVDALMKRS
ncbi:acylneuraminate cytidylyltransferase family protein [Thalassobacillus hwangdonensis]|uniref:Cytidylyltransferase domain-containing protein n=1 Tax=Thalassobacillus hwangdonensis TaxID=546108 RepID=A0ABW3L4G2_9BACI